MRQRLARFIRARVQRQLPIAPARTAELDHHPGDDDQFGEWVKDARDQKWLTAIRKLEPRT
jgi:hypothetical protein